MKNTVNAPWGRLDRAGSTAAQHYLNPTAGLQTR